MRGALLLILAAGCGGIAYEDYRDELLDANCRYLVRCRAADTLEDCRAIYEHTQITLTSLNAAVNAGLIHYDEDAAQGCIDAYDALSCDKTRQPAAVFDACSRAFVGQVEVGGACEFDGECGSDRCVVPDCPDQCCPGTCAKALVLPRVGEPCTALCADDAFCAPDSTCHALLPAGAACDNFASLCQPPLQCAGLSTSGSGVCTVLPHEGEACEFMCAETASLCVGGTCKAAGLPGDPCADSNACADLYTCTLDGMCSRYPARGMACTDRCSDDSYCESGTCVAPKPDGEPCSFLDGECASHFCGNGSVCSDPPRCF
jgi:hypothetical protein